MLGGLLTGHRELMTEGAYGHFEQDVDRLLGDRIRADEEDGKLMWGALANVDWEHKASGDEVGYSFRAAGDLVAALRKDDGQMTYMRYYCSVPYPHVPDWIESALASAGWTAVFLEAEL